MNDAMYLFDSKIPSECVNNFRNPSIAQSRSQSKKRIKDLKTEALQKLRNYLEIKDEVENENKKRRKNKNLTNSNGNGIGNFRREDLRREDLRSILIEREFVLMDEISSSDEQMEFETISTRSNLRRLDLSRESEFVDNSIPK
ncbi:hypothetical protein MHBO_005067, partial [Bonamia ostreae]